MKLPAFRAVLASAALASLTTIAALPTRADEGMWTYHAFPTASVREKFGVTLDQGWLDRVRLSTVRLSGCSASFVSPDGLILTNHHCIESCLADLSTEQDDLIANGFLANDRARERRCETQVADVLVEMTDVTADIAAAVAGKDEKAANEARKQTLTQLEQTCEAASQKKKTGPRKCQAVNLYNGGQYWLYQYKRYTDVRAVFAPERSIAAFGGDPDNFQFPRWCLDMGILRAYENGKPAKTPNYLKINFAGPAAGDLTLVSGHPGSTDRLLSLAELRTQRDYDLPRWLLRAAELRGRYVQYGKTGAEAARTVDDLLNSLENGIKVRRKELDALLDESLIARKQAEEAALRKFVAETPSAVGPDFGNPWAEIEKAQRVEQAITLPYTFIENGAGWGGRLASTARTLVRAADERAKPNPDRLREFTDGALPRIEQQLGAKVPVYPEVEILRITFGLERMREWLGPDHTLVRRLLSKESPDELARRWVTGTKLADPEARLALWRGGKAAIEASDDPLIVFARSVEAEARALRKQYDDEVEAPIQAASEKIARARFAALGTSVYPDATFTLRLNYGSVQGWNESGADVVPFTRLSRAFERATGAEPFRIPASWERAKAQLDMNTPFNLATNNDIVGGNSGSPVVNAKGEIVGLVFDGNIHSISGSYWFDTAKNRTVAVHPAIMREALQKVYRADGLLRELGVK